MKTRVVNAHLSEYDIYIGRPSFWGNPFKSGEHGTRSKVIEMYRQHVLSSPEMLSRLHELKGKRLGCWCKPKACHGDVLAELADKSDLLSF